MITHLHFAGVDIILGAPPYVNYDESGEHHDYARRMARLIRNIADYQGDHHVFFVAEIAAIRQGQYVSLKAEDKLSYDAEFRVCGQEFDSKFVSPVERLSTFFTNIPLSGSMCTTDLLPACFPYHNCLMDGYEHGGSKCCQDPAIRFHAFLSSQHDIDRSDTIVFRVGPPYEENPYLQRPLKTLEREMLMCMPREYVHGPGKVIYCALRIKMERSCLIRVDLLSKSIIFFQRSCVMGLEILCECKNTGRKDSPKSITNLEESPSSLAPQNGLCNWSSHHQMMRLRRCGMRHLVGFSRGLRISSESLTVSFLCITGVDFLQ
jgi:hypothetical protein